MGNGDVIDAAIVPDVKTQLDTANKLLSRIAILCLGALDPELTREAVIVRVKSIYSLAVFDDDHNEGGELP